MEANKDIIAIKKIVSNVGIISEYDRVVNESSELLRKMNVRIQSGQLKRVRFIIFGIVHNGHTGRSLSTLDFSRSYL